MSDSAIAWTLCHSGSFTHLILQAGIQVGSLSFTSVWEKQIAKTSKLYRNVRRRHKDFLWEGESLKLVGPFVCASLLPWFGWPSRACGSWGAVVREVSRSITDPEAASPPCWVTKQSPCEWGQGPPPSGSPLLVQLHRIQAGSGRDCLAQWVSLFAARFCLLRGFF